jgi:RHS repeat-associated protein
MAAQLSENSHQGFDGIKAALCLGSMKAKSNTASGMPVCLWRNGIGSRSSGKERDAETGLDYFGARYYSGAQGRFTSADPLLNSGRPDIPQSWNRYSYTLNNPLRFIDPDGLWEWDVDKCKGDKKCIGKRDDERQWFRDAVTGLEEAIRLASTDPTSAEYLELQSIRRLVGTENDGGIVVSFDITKRMKERGGAGGSKGGIVYFDAMSLINAVNEWKNAGHKVDMKAESAGTIAHEFHEKLFKMGRDVSNYENVFRMEIGSYSLQSSVNYLFNTESMWGLWNPSWAQVDGHLGAMRKRSQAIKANAQKSTDEALGLKRK